MKPPCNLCGKDGCLFCRLWHTSAAYRNYWESGRHKQPADFRGEPATRVELPVCIHFTDVAVDRTDPDGNECACTTKHLYRCDIHGRCAQTSLAARPGVPCCERGRPDSCNDYDDGSADDHA